jgi:hydrophobe/amphiphile efflux-1 (HAE1) family protein
MKFSHIFIKRPIFAAVLSVLILIVGGLAYVSLPVSQFPDVAPPTVEVVALYPGANARTLSETVAAPLEKEINGVEGMLYMTSQSSADGRVVLQIAFELGTDLDRAQVQVQNRVAIAEPRLPESVRRLGITTKKISPDILLVVNMYSPNKTYDQTYMGNYATLQLKDELARIKGIGDIQIFGAAEYAMRIWLDPDKIANLDMTAGEVVAALRSQNVQIASGTLNTLPSGSQSAFEINIQTQGKLITTEQFESVIIKSNADGRIVQVKDIGWVELGAQNYATKGYLGKDPAIAMPIFQQPGGNALETAAEIQARMVELSKNFPEDLEYKIAYNPTEFIQKSVDEVYNTIFEAVILVVLVILLFLQSWRAAIIPILAIPVSLIGTFAVMQAIGFSLNNLTLFGLVLAIGIVVDDAIVVVENMERYLAKGLSPKEAAQKTMDEVGGALIAIGLVLIAVFIPTTFLDGISGQFYKQFGMTIAVATTISVFVSLTLSPAMAALLMRHKEKDSNKKTPLLLKPFAYVGNGFNGFMDRLSRNYGKSVQKLVRMAVMVLLVYGGLVTITGFEFNRVSKGFIPAMDQQYFITLVQLPPGSSLSRTDEVMKEVLDIALDIDGVENAVSFTGFDAASFTNASNAAAVFLPLEDFEVRRKKGLKYEDLLATVQQKLGQIDDAIVFVIPPPSVRGVGNAGGFRMMVQDRANLGTDELLKATYALAAAANEDPIVNNVFTFFNNQTPQLYLDIDRVKAEKLGVNVGDVFQSLEIYMGSAFVNEFNYLGRTFQVTAQADAPNRLTPDDIARIKVRNNQGEMVPLGTITSQQDISGPSRIPRFNLYPAASLNGNVSPGYSSGEALDRMEQLADEILPQGISFEWTELAYQEKQTGNTAGIAFFLAVVFVFLLLAAQFESLVLPLAVIFIVPMVLLSAMIGIDLAGLDNNIMVQIGLIVLVGLASKNAILIVEFAKQLEDQGEDLKTAVIEASKLRLRPILMTAMAFILGVVPLAIATGAGAELRVSLGIAVFSGMLGVTIFGIFLTPVFYYLGRKWTTKSAKADTIKPIPSTAKNVEII